MQYENQRDRRPRREGREERQEFNRERDNSYKEMVAYESDNVEIYNSFDDMDLPEQLLRGIYSYGWEKPSVIQSKSIMVLKSGRDLIAQAQSGTGKTGSFTIGTASNIEPSIEYPQLIMLSNVRDLAIQTYNIVKQLTSFMNIKVTLLIGKGQDSDEEDDFKIPPPIYNAQIIVGTPGKVWDSLRRKLLNNKFLRMLIMDEADEVLSLGFQNQIKEIFEFLPTDAQVALFSATINENLMNISRQILRNPVKILMPPEELTLEGIEQYYVKLPNESIKFEVLLDLYENISINQAIIFVNSKPKVDELEARLKEKNYAISTIHGGMSQFKRNKILDDFRRASSRILIATDVLSRGIDIQQVSLVINYDLPIRIESYIHRIGRSGRFGKKGIAINFMTIDDIKKMDTIARNFNASINPLPNNLNEVLRVKN
jgi:superfamily II DNA/RNA helicase